MLKKSLTTQIDFFPTTIKNKMMKSNENITFNSSYIWIIEPIKYSFCKLSANWNQLDKGKHLKKANRQLLNQFILQNPI